MPMSSDADADVDADDDADADGDQNADANVERHFIINHPIYKARAMTMAKMLTLSDEDDFDLDGDMEYIGVRIMGSWHRHLFTSTNDDMTMAMRRYGDDGDMTMAKMLTLSDGDDFDLDDDMKHIDVRIMGSRHHHLIQFVPQVPIQSRASVQCACGLTRLFLNSVACTSCTCYRMGGQCKKEYPPPLPI